MFAPFIVAIELRCLCMSFAVLSAIESCSVALLAGKVLWDAWEARETMLNSTSPLKI